MSNERKSILSPFTQAPLSKQKQLEEKQYKKLFVSSEIQRAPQTVIETNEKERS